jgi:hypothetical protein
VKAGDVVRLKSGEHARLKGRVSPPGSNCWWAELPEPDGTWPTGACDLTHLDEEDVMEVLPAQSNSEAAVARRNVITKLLGRAVAELKVLVPHLNVKESACGACGRKHYEDWDDAQLSEAVKGSIEKLERWSDKYKRKV